MHSNFDNSIVDETGDSDTDINFNANDNDLTYSESEQDAGGDSDVETEVVANDISSTSTSTHVDKVNNHHYRWHKREAPQIHTEYTSQAFPPPQDPVLTPYQYFKMFDDAILANIADNTNLYAVQLTGTLLATDEIQIFLGIFITFLDSRKLKIA